MNHALGNLDLRARGACIAFAIFALLLFSKAALAQSVIVKEAWTRATAPGQKTAAVYLDLVSGADAALVGVKSPAAPRAEIHASRMEGGVMKMRPVDRLPLPAGKTVRLAPGGYHIMLLGVAQPLREHQTIPLELEIEGARGAVSKLDVRVEVRGQTTGSHRHTH